MAREPERPPPPSYEGSVVMDIGGDIGGLVIYTPDDLVGQEIEIHVEGEVRPNSHTAVRERRLGRRTLYAGVFGSLPSGRYTLPDGEPVTVAGGRITEVHWVPAIRPGAGDGRAHHQPSVPA